MSAAHDVSRGFSAVFVDPGTSSFTQFLSMAAPELLPGRRPLPPGAASDLAPHATTIVALVCRDGVVIDRKSVV